MEEVRVLRHESERSSWTLVSRDPDPRLLGLVVGYQDYIERSAAAPVLRQQVPTTRLPLIVNFGSSWSVAASETGPGRLHESFAAGLGERSSYVAATGAASCVQVDLTPLGAFALFGSAMHELANEIVSLDDVLPREKRHLTEQLAALDGAEARFALLDALFVRRMAEGPTPSDDVAWAWTALEQTHGRAPIGWICNRLGRSRRHLATRFREQIGLPPKTVARILRFNRALALLRRGDALVDVAFTCGYYDQAHLNRDFRAFAERSPGSFAQRLTPDDGVVV